MENIIDKDIIHYLGIDDNLDLINDIKSELAVVIEYSKKHNLEYCLVDDLENGYFKNFKLIKQFNKLCCIKEMEV